MADGVYVLPASGAGKVKVSADEITTLNGSAVAAEEAQRIKVGFGSDGSLRDVDATHGLPVEIVAGVALDLSAAALSALENITVGGTVELGATSLAALESITATGPLTDTQLRASAVPISVGSLPLPSGAATAANQASANTLLASLATLLAGGLPAALVSGALPVTLQTSLSSGVDSVTAVGDIPHGQANGIGNPILMGAVANLNDSTLANEGARVQLRANYLGVLLMAAANDNADYGADGKGISGFGTRIDTSLLTVKPVAVGDWLFSSANHWVRQRDVSDSANTTGVGVAAAGLYAQLDDTATGTVTEDNYGPVRMTVRRSLLTEGIEVPATSPVGNLTRIGVVGSDVAPTTVAAGQMVGIAANRLGFLLMGASQDPVNAGADGVTGMIGFGSPKFTDITTIRPVAISNFAFNGSNHDRYRNNIAAILLASAARTSTQTSATIVNYNHSRLTWVVNVTSAGTGSITPSLQVVDANGITTTIWTAAAPITSNGTYVYSFVPGVSTAASFTENVPSGLPSRSFKLVITANNANSVTYSSAYEIGL